MICCRIANSVVLFLCIFTWLCRWKLCWMRGIINRSKLSSEPSSIYTSVWPKSYDHPLTTLWRQRKTAATMPFVQPGWVAADFDKIITTFCVEFSEGKSDAISVGNLDPPFTACVVRIITGEVRRGERSVPSVQVNWMIGTSSSYSK